MSLTDEAQKIINQNAQTEEDIIQLSKIVYMMSSLYRDKMNLANEQEQRYNLTRSQETQKAMESWKKITEAAEFGKLKAEEQYGDYRTMEADCKWMLQVMNSIREFKIAWFVSNKWTTDFISNNRNMKDDA